VGARLRVHGVARLGGPQVSDEELADSAYQWMVNYLSPPPSNLYAGTATSKILLLMDEVYPGGLGAFKAALDAW